MKHRFISFSPALILGPLALLAAPLAAWADAKPDFDDDAKPILSMQPGLLQYVESKFDVKDTGSAKYPGDDDRRPGPPFIFFARPAGSHGPYNLRLLIQPGPINHILNVVDITRVNQGRPPGAPAQPSMANRPPTQPPAQAPAEAQAPAPSAPAPAPQPSEPTADTPSGPILDSGAQAPASTQPSLAPPPDPAPATR
jgi:hypothetical protein